MASRPAEVPVWNTGGLNRSDPGSGKEALGWESGEEATSSWQNWLSYYTGAWLQYLSDGVFVGPSSGSPGLQATGGGGNARGVYALGTGTGDGVTGVGSGAAIGVRGVGGSSGVGVYGQAAGGNSAGVQGDGIGSGAGVSGLGGATGYGLRGVGGATSGAGVYGSGTAGNSAGVLGTPHGTGAGLYGESNLLLGGAAAFTYAGVVGVGVGAGVHGEGQDGGHGGHFWATGGNGNGIRVFGSDDSGNNPAGYFEGRFGNQPGIQAVGYGTGSGGVFTAGSSGDADGIRSTGHGTYSGVAGFGGATGAGVYGESGASATGLKAGVWGKGLNGVAGGYFESTSNGHGVRGYGAGTGKGGVFYPGGSGRAAIDSNGTITFAHTMPATNAAISDELCEQGFFKAFATVAFAAGASPAGTPYKGFNVSSVTTDSSGNITVTFASAFADFSGGGSTGTPSYGFDAVLYDAAGATTTFKVTAMTKTTVTFYFFDDAGAAVDDSALSSKVMWFTAFGAQST